MLFPITDRVIYQNNPLDNVVCQIRFSPVLKIDAELPSDFQKAIIKDFPIYSENMEYQGEISFEVGPQIINQQNPFSKVSTTKNHQFTSEDGVWKVNLTRTFLSLSTSNYVKWEDFLARFLTPFQALLSIYEIPFFTRVGLRYVDVFCRSNLKLGRNKWSSLIQPQFLGLLGSSVKDNITGFSSIFELQEPEAAIFVRINSALVNNTAGEQCFMLDSDIFDMKRTNPDQVEEKLKMFNSEAGRIIRWAIKDKLHYAMVPRKVEANEQQ